MDRVRIMVNEVVNYKQEGRLNVIKKLKMTPPINILYFYRRLIINVWKDISNA